MGASRPRETAVVRIYSPREWLPIAAQGGSEYALMVARMSAIEARRLRRLGFPSGHALRAAGDYRREAMRCRTLEQHGIVLGWRDVDWHAVTGGENLRARDRYR